MKKLLLLVVLLVGVAFLLTPGAEYNAKNRAIASINVWSEVAIDFESLSEKMTEAEAVTRFGSVKWDCGIEPSKMGERSCFSHVRTVNGAPAWHIALFFDQDQLSQVKIDLAPDGHRKLLAEAKASFGEGRPMREDQNGIPIVGWMLEGGILATNEQTMPEGTTQLLWLSGPKVMKGLLNRMTGQ
jgi:hypothetical protein